MNPYYVESMQKKDLEDVKKLLEKNHLKLEDTVDYTAVLKHKGTVVGTCSCEKNILKSFAIKFCYQGSGGASQLLTHVINRLFDEGHYTVMAFTPSGNREIFEGMHFRCIYDSGKVVLMAAGYDNLSASVQKLVQSTGPSKGIRSAIVMNGNPFTKGHLALIETAAKETDEVIVFVVEEDRSVFSFKDRMELIRKGTGHLANVQVISGGPYMVSMATFPNYFVRDASEHARWSAELDAGIFGSVIAQALQITRRYVGTEPFCRTTALYNQVLKAVLSQHRVELHVMERIEEEGSPVSASEVRRLLALGKWEEIEKIVPESTLEFLQSDAALKSIRALEREVRPH